jgi:hypothetical protein
MSHTYCSGIFGCASTQYDAGFPFLASFSSYSTTSILPFSIASRSLDDKADIDRQRLDMHQHNVDAKDDHNTTFPQGHSNFLPKIPSTPRIYRFRNVSP